MENKEVIYYCKQGDPYCVHPKCLCNTVRPENNESFASPKEKKHILNNGGDHDGQPCTYTMCYSRDENVKDKCLGWCEETPASKEEPNFEEMAAEIRHSMQLISEFIDGHAQVSDLKEAYNLLSGNVDKIDQIAALREEIWQLKNKQ